MSSKAEIGAAFRRCLEEMDIAGARRLWAVLAPHLPAPASDLEAIVSLHMARTAANSLRLRDRAYSHRWLLDNGFPSRLPDHLRPRAERIYPEIRDSVGIAVGASSEITKPIVPLVRQAMSDAVLECYADGHKAPEIVKPRMMEARAKTVRKLVGL